jgi:hypothetical protein
MQERVTATLTSETADLRDSSLFTEDAAAPNAWKIMARLLYYQRHGYCDGCIKNPTGMACIYLNFDGFLEARQIPALRSDNWQKLLHTHLGL